MKINRKHAAIIVGISIGFEILGTILMCNHLKIGDTMIVVSTVIIARYLVQLSKD